MALYENASGDSIKTEGMKYTVTRNNVEQNFDLSHWAKNAEDHIDGDIWAGYYLGFKKVEA